MMLSKTTDLLVVEVYRYLLGIVLALKLNPAFGETPATFFGSS